MPSPRPYDLLVRAARLYYEDGLSQSEVAARLDISRSSISRVLASAREKGIVQIRVHDPMDRDHEIEAELDVRVPDVDVWVAHTLDGQAALDAVGRLAARHLEAHLPSAGGIGISWGSGLQSMVRHVSPHQDHPMLEVVPLVGGLSTLDTADSGDEIARELAARLGARRKRLFAPALVESVPARDVFLAEPSIASVLQDGVRARIAYVGIGAAGYGGSSQVVAQMHLDDDERAAFEAARPVGDMCARFFDRHGHIVRSPAEDRVVGVSLDELRRIPVVVGVAAGVHKLPGVLGALRSGLLASLVVDDELGRALAAVRI